MLRTCSHVTGIVRSKVSGLISNYFFSGYKLKLMKKVLPIFALIFFVFINGNSQKSSLFFDVKALVGGTSSGYVPFWLRSNQYGSIPLDNASLSLIGAVRKDYDTSKTRIFDWGASAEGRANIGHKSNFTLIEGYGKLRISVFEIRAGRSREIMGICDTSLSSGAFAVSGNALGIPKVQISIPEFYSIPIFGKLFAFKGSFAYGWVGKTSQYQFPSSIIIHLDTYLHQKSFYGRFGKPDWKLKLYGGFNHQVYWGNEKELYVDLFTLSPMQTYLYVITGKPYGTNNIGSSKIGNHLGSIDLGFEYEFDRVRILAYRQNFYDCGALYYLANIRDGLNGLSLSNTRQTGNGFQWKKMLIEVLNSKNQAGEFWSPPTPSGDENYYNNDQFLEGWSYKGIGIGNPFICPRASTREGLPSDPRDYFINNRVIAFHFGFEGSFQKWDFIVKTSYSLNYGTFGTSEVGHTLGKYRTLPVYGIFSETKQLSTYFEANKELRNGLNFGFTGAFDAGELYYNSVGLLFRISKSF